jgi:SAM-dependent methyltransferase
VADLPFQLPGSGLRGRLAAALDQEAKIPRTLDAIGRVADADVLLLDADGGLRARQLTELGARVHPLADLWPATQADGSADVVVSCWAGFDAGAETAEAHLAEARRVLRPGGRLLVVQDYGRDDLVALGAGVSSLGLSGRHRDGWFLERGFKVRVIHAWWTFETIEEAREFLSEAFGEAGQGLAASLRRPRLSHKIVVYHLTA